MAKGERPRIRWPTSLQRRTSHTHRSSPSRLTMTDVFMLTAIAKMGSTLVTYPLLLVKSRLQVGESSRWLWSLSPPRLADVAQEGCLSASASPCPPPQAMNRHTDSDASYSGVLDAVARILRTEGISGFFKGMKVRGMLLIV